MMTARASSAFIRLVDIHLHVFLAVWAVVPVCSRNVSTHAVTLQLNDAIALIYADIVNLIMRPFGMVSSP